MHTRSPPRSPAASMLQKATLSRPFTRSLFREFDEKVLSGYENSLQNSTRCNVITDHYAAVVRCFCFAGSGKRIVFRLSSGDISIVFPICSWNLILLTDIECHPL